MIAPASRVRVRVLIADDSAVVRRLVARVLSEDPEIDVVGVACDGKVAVALVEELEPDVVVLDVEMPVMDGLETLHVLRGRWPLIPVIMFSTVTERGAAATLDALAAGASDYVTKPSHSASIAQSAEHVRQELATRVKALSFRYSQYCALRAAAGNRVRMSKRQQSLSPKSPLATSLSSSASSGISRRVRTPENSRSVHRGEGRVEVVAIGVSTGGPNALAAILSKLPAELAAPIVIVQHMPPMFTRLLAERLDRSSPLRVQELGAEVKLEPGHVYLAAGGSHLMVKRSGVSLVAFRSDLPPENSCRPSVDVMFRSVAQTSRKNVLAVVLTGMGADGLAGARLIKDLSGHVIVQDEASSIVWGMPGVVANAGLADKVVPLDLVAHEIQRFVGCQSMSATETLPAALASGAGSKVVSGTLVGH